MTSCMAPTSRACVQRSSQVRVIADTEWPHFSPAVNNLDRASANLLLPPGGTDLTCKARIKTLAQHTRWLAPQLLLEAGAWLTRNWKAAVSRQSNLIFFSFPQKKHVTIKRTCFSNIRNHILETTTKNKASVTAYFHFPLFQFLK